MSYSFTHSILQHCLPIKLYKHIYMSDPPEKLQQEASNTAVTGELTHGPPQYIHVLRHNRRTLNTDGPQRASTVPPSHDGFRQHFTFMQSFKRPHATGSASTLYNHTVLHTLSAVLLNYRQTFSSLRCILCMYMWPRNTKPVISKITDLYFNATIIRILCHDHVPYKYTVKFLP